MSQSSTQSADLAIPQGKNSAPIKPILDLKEKGGDKKAVDHDLTQQIKQKYEDLIGRDKTSWREMVARGQMTALFIEGHQTLEINEFTQMPRIVKPRANDINKIRAVNLMRYYSTNWQSKWSASNPDVLLTPYSNRDEAITQARKANAVVDYLEDKFYNPFFHLHEGLMAQIWGWYGRRVRPDFAAQSFSTFKEIVEERPINIGKGYGECMDCGHSGTDVAELQLTSTQMSACPQCQSPSYDYTPPVTANIKMVTGREKVFLPEIICEQLYFASTRWDLRKRYEDSGWAISEKYISKNALKQLLGASRLPEGESGNGFGLDALERLAKTGTANNGDGFTGTRSNGDDVVLTTMTLSAEEAYDIELSGEKTVDGHTLPKKRMGECTITGINGMSLIIGIHAGHHSKTDASGVYHMKPMSGSGTGVIDAVESQKQLNRRTAQLDRHIASRATPATLFVEGAIAPSDRQYLNRPDADIPVKIDNFPEFRSLDQLVRPMQGENAPATLVNSLQHIQGMMELQYHITDFTGGMGSRIKNDTATGAKILDSNADALFTPALIIKADVCVEIARKGFEQWCEHTPVARFLPFKKAGKNGSIGLEISGKDVKGEYKWSFLEGSEVPKTKYSEMEKKAQFFMQFGSAANYLTAKQQMPQEVAAIERAFDVSFGDDGYDTTSELCRTRWERGLEALNVQQATTQIGEMLGMVAPIDFESIISAIDPSLVATEGMHDHKIAWFVNLLNSEEGQVASKVERDLMGAFILVHKKLMANTAIGEGQLATEVQMEIARPAQEQIQAEEQGQQRKQLALDQVQKQEEGAREVATAFAQRDEADTQRAHDSEMKAADVAIAAVPAMTSA